MNRERQLHPRQGLRSSPVAGVVLTNGDVDAVAGLLTMRERTPFVIYAHPRILAVLEDNPIFGVLAPDVVRQQPFQLGEKLELRDAAGNDCGLRVTPFAVKGKVALYMEKDGQGDGFGTQEGDTIGLEFSDAEGSARVLHVANCAAVSDDLRARCDGAELLFFDGTLWRDDEMIAGGEGKKTGQRMGHMSMAGKEGSIAALSGLSLGRKVFIHINNTNPVLLADTAERRELQAAGWEVGYDGMEITLP
jgi:pyrroloquinoline quinone biosynthesis protein B